MEKKRLKEAKNVFIKRSFVLGIIAILICWFMKLIGFDIFGLDLNNKFFNDLDKLMSNKEWLKQIYFTITLLLQVGLLTCIVNNIKFKEVILYLLITSPITILLRVLTSVFVNELGNVASIIEIIYLIVITSRFKINKLVRSLFIILFTTIYQLISINTRSLELKAHELGFVATQILYIDYYLLLYLHKEVSLMNDGTFIFFGLTAWLYAVAGFIVGLFTLHPIKKAKEYYAKGKEKEDARKTKKKTTKTAKAK